MKKLWKALRNLFKKKLKPRKNIDERDVIASGYVQAGDFLCIKEIKDEHNHKK